MTSSPMEGLSPERREEMRGQALALLDRLGQRTHLNLLLLKVLVQSSDIPEEAVQLVTILEADVEFMLKGLHLVASKVPVEPSAEERAKS